MRDRMGFGNAIRPPVESHSDLGSPVLLARLPPLRATHIKSRCFLVQRLFCLVKFSSDALLYDCPLSSLEKLRV